MTSFDAATLAQNRASEPGLSTWLSANAGSGKTKVLTDRVARLLLRGVSPQRILCLTYTKAAAGEMQNRLFKLLGKWAMLPDDALRAQLVAIGEDAIHSDLSEARRLFARAIETPGGLKIQTIHSFCAALLRRFPLEAGLSPAFVEMDERAAEALRDDVLNRLAEGPSARALGDLVELLSDHKLSTLLADLSRNSRAFAGPVPIAALRAACGLPDGVDRPEDVIAQVILGDEAATRDRLMPALLAGSPNDQKLAKGLAALDFDAPAMATLEALEGLLLTKTGANPFTAKIGSLPTKDTRIALGDAMGPFEALMRRVEAGRALRLGVMALERALALHTFARAWLPAYDAAKMARGVLDFDDLITRTAQLLTDPAVAQWVLFKLDGGVDHILVDEAQDTGPIQWQVIAQLTQEFTAGAGARDTDRTLFVVGDKKQSIYSFQGADLQVFDQMQVEFRNRLNQVGQHLHEAQLSHSFRSSDAVLRSVDQSFDDPSRAQGLGGVPQHLAFHLDMPGRVDLWPVLPKADPGDDGAWFDPVDRISEEHELRQLARMIAREIRAMIDARTPIRHKDGVRPMTEGDVLILVRRRKTLFHELIAACKAEGLEMAGADRLRLGAEMAVRDLTALLSFLDLPEDDLSLAALLRSPLLGWSEDALFRLSQGRAKGEFLWTRLRAVADAPTRALLDDMLNQADFLRPYELLDRVLTRHDGRRRLLARLGAEAEEGIDALLTLALSYEAQDLPSLGGFVDWLSRGDTELRRQVDANAGALRVMTVHGAKGLEAPVVILPETADYKNNESPRTLTLPDGLVTAAGSRASLPPELQAALEGERAKRELEDQRLLYVAMTRAESWLIVAAAGETKSETCWHNVVSDGLKRAGATGQDFPTGRGLRLEHGSWPGLGDGSGTPPPAAATPDIPEALRQQAAPPVAGPRPLGPSDLGGAKVLPQPGLPADPAAQAHAPDDPDGTKARARGHALHLLLEHLPHWPKSSWDTRAADLLAASDGGVPDDLDALLADARAVLENPDMAPFLSPDALAEVDIRATLSGVPLQGTIDRLLVAPDLVRALDYKSNRLVPDRPEDVPEGLLRQMGAYRAALLQVFPGRAVQVALVWTRAQGKVMWLPDALVDAALARALLENIPSGA